MSSLNSHAFFRQWQMLYDASNPDHLEDRWKVDGIDWTKERHAYWGENYSTQYEVHRLVHWEGRELAWQLLVVVERWLGAGPQKMYPEHLLVPRDNWQIGQGLGLVQKTNCCVIFYKPIFQLTASR
jgi:hypothetical protein